MEENQGQRNGQSFNRRTPKIHDRRKPDHNTHDPQIPTPGLNAPSAMPSPSVPNPAPMSQPTNGLTSPSPERRLNSALSQGMPMPNPSNGDSSDMPRPVTPSPSMPLPNGSTQTSSFLTKNELSHDNADEIITDDDQMNDDLTVEDDDYVPPEDDDLFGSMDAEAQALAQLKAKEKANGSLPSKSNRGKGYGSMAQALTAEYALVASDEPDEIRKIKALTAKEDAALFQGMDDLEHDDVETGPEVLEEVDTDGITSSEADAMLGIGDAIHTDSSSDGDDHAGLEDLYAELKLPYRDPSDPAPELDELDAEAQSKIIARVKKWLDGEADRKRREEAAKAASSSDDDGDHKKRYVIHADENYMLIEDYDSDEMPSVDASTLDDLLNDAIDRGASDVHLAVDRPIKLRINGALYSFMKYRMMRQADMETLITTAISFISNEKRTYLNQKKSVDTSYTVDRGAHKGERFRVHFMDEMNGTAIVMRHIRPQIFTPEEIGLPRECVEWGDLSSGLVLVTGPTGSGKSASLSSILHHIQMTRSKKIITLEEPIETTYPVNEGKADVIQREIPENCPSFTAGIRDAMREDPDVILVGEIRDFDTIDASLQASNTGHLTFATIHANSAPAVITRILDLAGADSDKDKLRSDLSDQLKGIMSQRLLLKPGNDGRVAVREIVRMGRRQVEQIKKGDITAMYDDLRRDGMDMDSQMIELLLEGRTVLTSVHEACADREELDERISLLPDEWKRRIIIDADQTGGDVEDDDEDDPLLDDWDQLTEE